MRILIVTPEFFPKVGGMGRSACRLALAFAAAEHDTRLLTYDRSADLQTSPYTKLEFLNESAVQILRVGPIATKRTGALADTKATLKRQFVAQSLKTLREHGFMPDVVLSLGLVDAGFVGLCISQALEKPHVISARGADVGTEIFQGDKFPLAQWVVSHSAAVTFVNRYLCDIASSVFGALRNSHVIMNGVDDPGEEIMLRLAEHAAAVRERLGIPPTAKVIGWTGTFREKKGIPYLDRAFRILVDQGRDLYLLVVGGPRNEVERSLCSSIDDTGPIGKRVRCVGLLEQPASVYPFYAAMDIFVYPSLDDGMSNSLLEAMVFGLPVVTTDIFADVAVDQSTALLVRRFDVAGIVCAVTAILDDPAIGPRLGSAARTLMLNEFTTSNESEKYLSLLRSLVAENPSVATP